MVKDGIKKTKVGGRIFLHANPKKGDYVVYKTYGFSKNKIKIEGSVMSDSLVNSMMPEEIFTYGTLRYEIIDIKDENIFIRQTNQFSSSVNTQITQTLIEFEVDKTGLQIRRTILEAPYLNEPITVEAVKPGEEGFVETSQDKNPIKTKISTSIGDFVTTPIYAVQQLKSSSDDINGKSESITNTNAIVFNNPNVKFQTVFIQGSSTSSITAEASKELKLLLKTLNSTATYFANPSSGAKSIFDMGLKGYVQSEAKGLAKDKLNDLIGDIDKIQAKGAMDVSGYSILSEQGNIFSK